MHKIKGCEVWLFSEGKAVTRFTLDLLPEMVIDEVLNGRRRFKRFGSGATLAARQCGSQVWIWPATQAGPGDALSRMPRLEPAARKDGHLTGRQRQVLEGIAGGQTQAQISLELGIRPRTVRHHVDELKQRLGAVSLSQLVAHACLMGLINSTPPQGGTGAGRHSKHPKMI